MKKLLKYFSLMGLSILIASPGPVLGLRKRVKAMAVSRVLSLMHREAPRLDPQTRKEVALLIEDLARTYHLDPLLILAIIKVESTFKPQAVSKAQAYGLMQVRSIVVRQVANELGIDPRDTHRLMEHEFNIRVGVYYLSFLIQKFGGDINKALMAYNAGPTNVARLYKHRPAPTGGYQGRVLKAYRNYQQVTL